MKYKMITISLLYVGLLLALPGQTNAESPFAAQTDEGSWENLNQLQVGQKIEVVQTDLKKLKGTFLSLTEEAISLRVKKDDVGVPRVNVLRVGSLDRPKRKRNIVLGVALGAGLGMAAGIGLSYA